MTSTAAVLKMIRRRGGLAEAVTANIRAELARRGLRQADVATYLGLSQPTVSDRMRGKTPWTLDEVGLLADLMGMDPELLLVRHQGLEPRTR